MRRRAANHRSARRGGSLRLMWASLLCVVALVAAACGDDDGDGEDPEADASAEQIAELETENAALEDANGELEAEVEALEEQVDTLATTVEELAEQADELAAGVTPVPSYVTRDANDAIDEATGRGWTVSVIEQDFTESPPGTVIGQAPNVGTPMTDGSSLVLYVAFDPANEWQSVQVFRGDGPSNTTTVLLDGAQARLLFAFSGEGTNTVTLVDPSGNAVEQLVGVVGAQAGEILIPFSGEYSFAIGTDDGARWSIEVEKRG